VALPHTRLVQEIWQRAEQNIGGTSANGSEKHAYAKRMLDIYQKMQGTRGLSTEVRYINGGQWQKGMPTKGSVILDVVEGNLENPTAVYDYKFGISGLTKARISQIRNVAGFNSDVPILVAP
jgi:hypothetical protein